MWRGVLIVAVLGLIAMGVGTSADAAVEARDFDFDGNGQIDAGREEDAFLKHVHLEIYRAADTNKDGELSRAELDAYAEEELVEAKEDFHDQLDGRSGMPIAEADREFGLKEPKSFVLPGGLTLRRGPEDVTLLRGPTPAAKAEGALVSYSRDMDGGSDLWTLRGALGKYWIVNHAGSGDEGSTKLDADSKAVVLAFDRVDGSGESAERKEVDSLSLRGVAEWLFTGGGVFDSQLLRGTVAYATDFGFQSKVIASEWEYEVAQLDWHIGVARPLFGLPLELRWRPIAHAEFGHTLDRGEKTNLEDDDTFFRVGPRLAVQFWPTIAPLNRLSAQVNWRYLYGLAGEPRRSDLLEASLAYELDEAGHATVVLNYRNGSVPLVEDETETLTLGFGLKF